MSLQAPIRDTPLFRDTDPETSRAAAARARAHLAESQEEVILTISGFALTDPEIRELAERAGTHQTPSGLRTRRKELVDQGLVQSQGKEDGFTVWRLTTAGREVLRILERRVGGGRSPGAGNALVDSSDSVQGKASPAPRPNPEA